jgi:PBSX family phage terminase large subunit
MTVLDEAPAGMLSDKQLDFIVNSNARVSLATGAIRSGKTLSSLIKWLHYVSRAPLGGELVMAGKTVYTVGRNVLLPLMDPLLFGDLAKYTSYTLGAPTATILGRRVHVIGAADIRAETKLRGLTCAGSLVDEATLVGKEFFSQLLGRMSVPGSQLIATSNPAGPAHWLRQDFILRQDELDLRHWHFTLEDNPSLTEKYKADIRSEFTGLHFRRYVLGEWCAAEGAIFDMWDEGRHVVDFVPPIKEWLCCSIDYGTTAPFAALVLGLGVDNVLYATAEWRWDSRLQHRQLSDPEYSERLREWLRTEVPIPGTKLKGVSPQYFIVDPSAASFRVQLYRDGVNPSPADNSVIDGIRLVSSLLAKDKLRIHRSCTGLITEFPGYSWSDEAAAKGEDKPVKVDDHSLDSLRYGCRSTMSLWHDRVGLAAAA